MKTLAQQEIRKQTLARILSLTPIDQALWGKMRVEQMICHVSDSYRLGCGEFTALPLKSPLPPSIYKWLALNVPTKWPKHVPTTPEMNQTIGGTPPAHFEEDRKRLIASLDAFISKTDDFPPHPIFQKMRREEWMRWGYLHVDHHLRQFGR